MSGSPGSVHLSFLLPVHNEAGSLPQLSTELEAAGERIGEPFEILWVDDASSDGSGRWLDERARSDPRHRVLHQPERRGQSAALAAGIAAVRGAWLVTLDADLQNDPADAPALVAGLAEAHLVCGVRGNRHDTAWKRMGSRIANGVRRFVLRDRFRDVGCSLKAWRIEVARSVPVFDGFHRFLPILASAQGYRVVEMEVNHRARIHGASHYGNLKRAFRGLHDLLGVRWLLRRSLVKESAQSDAPRKEEAVP